MVEDDLAIAAMYRVKLEKEGWQVAVASDGVAGVEAAKEHRPDLVLLDIMLPKLDGFGVMEQLRADPATEDLKVIVLSNSHGSPDSLERARSLGVLGWLTKSSTTPTDLAQRLSRL